ncbi:uncharacterized protein LOC132204431 [Neocloeon triangulifer]|uniref:uncharacterized protein LOC132204431 n=1 Tax=Neocloeon triangulifer TaxID=2078957 RepID=UPI00286F8BD7|nr:uncharacterized protein LOC132204431 [Neocloeon triangulifer]
MGRPKVYPETDEEERVVGWKADLVAKVLAAVSAVSFSLFVLALMAVTDPLTATVLGHFRTHTCVLAQSYVHSGSTRCQGWSSCKNLCADPPVLYTCFHLLVKVYPLDHLNDTPTTVQNFHQTAVVREAVGNLSAFDVDEFEPGMSQEMSARLQLFPPSLEIFGFRIYGDASGKQNSSDPEEDQVAGRTVRFFVNAAGCGYDLNCSEFQQRFGRVGAKFPCQYSRVLNRTMPVDVDPDVDDPWLVSLLTPAVPALLSLASLAYLCVRGHCDLPRLIPRNVLIKMIRRRRTKVRKQLRLMQKRGSMRSNRSFKSLKSSAPNTPQSLEWKKRPLPNITVDGAEKVEDDLVVQLV